MSANTSDRRARTRVHFNRRVKIVSQGGRVTVKAIKDISLNGMFVETDDRPAVGQKCQIEVLLSDDPAGPKIKLEGQVAGQRADGLALHFTEMDTESFSHLKNVVLYNASDPDRVEAELESPGF